MTTLPVPKPSPWTQGHCYQCDEVHELYQSRCAACHSLRHKATKHDLCFAHAKLDVISRYAQGEYILDDDAAMLANDYGGMGIDQDPIVKLLWFRLCQLRDFAGASVQASQTAPFRKFPPHEQGE